MTSLTKLINLQKILCLPIVFLSLIFLSAKAGGSSTDKIVATGTFSGAATQNARLQYELSWFFGGKSQRGWHLYASLVRGLIGTGSESESEDFAEDLSNWQKSVGLPGTGILNSETWSKMVTIFQSRRIKNREVPPAEMLFQAPAADFYDPERPEELRQVERQTYAAYKQMIAAALADVTLISALDRSKSRLAPDGDFLKIISAFRSPAYQSRLRGLNPNSGRAGLAVNSPHFTGRTLDLYVGGEPVSTKDYNRAIQVKTPVYQWLVKNAGRFGFHPYFYEPWHWEYRGE